MPSAEPQGSVGAPAPEHIRDRYFHTMAKEQYLKKVKKKAEHLCRADVDEFARCMEGRLISALWACRELSTKMNACVAEHQRALLREDLERGLDAKQTSAEPPSQQQQ